MMEKEEPKMFNPNRGRVDIEKVWGIVESIPQILTGINDEVLLRVLEGFQQSIQANSPIDIRSGYEDVMNQVYKEKIEFIITQLESCVQR